MRFVRTPVLYVLASDPGDFYAEQLYVSIASLRVNSPGTFVKVLTDKATKDGLENRGAAGPKLLQAVDEWITVSLDFSLPKKLRSRLLKTGMRKYVDGDFLFIDSDTIIVQKLDCIDSCPSELALCLDHHCPLQEIPEKMDIINKCRRIGLDLSRTDFYFNSGVIYAKDTPAVRAFFESWQMNYLNGYEKGVNTDQQSLAQTIDTCSLKIEQLDGKWNCQLPFGARYMREACIFHYFGGTFANQTLPLYLLNDTDILSRIRACDVLPAEVDAVFSDFCKGISSVSFLASESEMKFWTTRRYRDLRRHFVPGKFSILEFLLKVRARLPFAR